MHIAYVNEAGEVYLPEFGWKRAGSSALLEHATPLIRMDAAEVRGRVAQALKDSGIAEQVEEYVNDSIHSWRCVHYEEDCTCFADLVGSLLEAVFRDQ
jgi:hypothetical protein